MKTIRNYITVLLVFLSLGISLRGQNYLNVQGNKLIDSRGQEVRLTGVNWFGFETNNLFPHGLWSRDTKSMLQQIKDQGFNCIRMPWCNKILDPTAVLEVNSYGTDPYTGVSPMNEYESTLESPVELLDVIVEWCQENNMKLILDNHSRQPDGYMNELLWYTDITPESKWIEDWVFLAERYKNYDAVVAMDLNNEPHGNYGEGASWGNSNPATDWNKAAERCGNAILDVNPNVLILVEGIELYENDVYWWGGNLKGARDYPVQLDKPEKLVYSPHEYGPTVFNQPWFSASDFPSNMEGIWEEHFAYLYDEEISHLLVGEFGIKDSEGVDEVWFDTFMAYMGNRYSWTFWCWNPNSGDTGGLLDDQWTDIVEWKMEKLRPYLADEIPNGPVNNTNKAPIAQMEASEVSIVTDQEIVFDGSSSSDPNGDAIAYSWNFGDGTSASGSIVTHSYSEIGSYTVTLTVKDVAGLTDTDSQNITVTLNETMPVANINVATTSGVEPFTTTFDASSSSHPEGLPMTYTWSFGDGNTATGQVVEHTFEAVGTYTITLTVDDGERTDNAFVTITVNPLISEPCDNPVTVSIPYIQSGTGRNCLVTTDDIGFVNSWNMLLVEVNGIDYTNTWSSDLPERIDGKYYIYFEAIYDWAQFEIGTLKDAARLSQITENSISLFPNPFNESAILRIQSPNLVNEIAVYDAMGKLVHKVENSDIKSRISVGGDLNSGLYFIKVGSDNKVLTYKFYKY